ncbi:hypothetical protein OF83DRAFT_1176393 [Amylostereum chailletii]|nr:hypothetical protein OF83DRAFT_1176393 [Amylostereum chailletii]
MPSPTEPTITRNFTLDTVIASITLSVKPGEIPSSPVSSPRSYGDDPGFDHSIIIDNMKTSTAAEVRWFIDLAPNKMSHTIKNKEFENIYASVGANARTTDLLQGRKEKQNCIIAPTCIPGHFTIGPQDRAGVWFVDSKNTGVDVQLINDARVGYHPGSFWILEEVGKEEELDNREHNLKTREAKLKEREDRLEEGREEMKT